jgi:hypothetical protein
MDPRAPSYEDNPDSSLFWRGLAKRYWIGHHLINSIIRAATNGYGSSTANGCIKRR